MLFREQLQQGLIPPDATKEGPLCMDSYRQHVLASHRWSWPHTRTGGCLIVVVFRDLVGWTGVSRTQNMERPTKVDILLSFGRTGFGRSTQHITGVYLEPRSLKSELPLHWHKSFLWRFRKTNSVHIRLYDYGISWCRHFDCFKSWCVGKSMISIVIEITQDDDCRIGLQRTRVDANKYANSSWHKLCSVHHLSRWFHTFEFRS